MGVWYDIESYPVVFQNGECPNALYAALDSNTVSVYNTHVVDQSLSTINGLATVASTDGSAKLKVTFDGQNPDGKNLKPNKSEVNMCEETDFFYFLVTLQMLLITGCCLPTMNRTRLFILVPTMVKTT